MYNLLRKIPTTFFTNSQYNRVFSDFFSMKYTVPREKADFAVYNEDTVPKIRPGQIDDAGNDFSIEFPETYNATHTDVFSELTLRIMSSMLHFTTGKHGYSATYSRYRNQGRSGYLGYDKIYTFTTGLRNGEELINDHSRANFCILHAYNNSVSVQKELKRFYTQYTGSFSKEGYSKHLYLKLPTTKEEFKEAENKLIVSNHDTMEPDIFTKINEELIKQIPKIKRILFGPCGVVIWVTTIQTENGPTPIPLTPEEIMLTLCTIMKTLMIVYPAIPQMNDRFVHKYKPSENEPEVTEIFGSEEYIKSFELEPEMKFFTELSTACMELTTPVTPPELPPSDSKKLTAIKQCFQNLMENNPVYSFETNPFYQMVSSSDYTKFTIGPALNIIKLQFKASLLRIEDQLTNILQEINTLKQQIGNKISLFKELSRKKAYGTISAEDEAKATQIQTIINNYPAILNFFYTYNDGGRYDDPHRYYDLTLFNKFKVSNPKEFEKCVKNYADEFIRNYGLARHRFPYFGHIADTTSAARIEKNLKALFCDPEYHYMPYVTSTIRIDLENNCIVHPGNNRGYQVGSPSVIPNPHLMRYNCYGSYENFIIDAIIQQDWPQMIELLIQAASELSWSDSPVVKQFIEYATNDFGEAKFIYVKDTDEWITFKELDERINGKVEI